MTCGIVVSLLHQITFDRNRNSKKLILCLDLESSKSPRLRGRRFPRRRVKVRIIESAGRFGEFFGDDLRVVVNTSAAWIFPPVSAASVIGPAASSGSKPSNWRA